MSEDKGKGNEAARNALTDLRPRPELGLIGPTVDDDIERAITRYGVKAVKAAAAKATKQKQGRKSTMDWSIIRHLIEADAVRWLEGGDPFEERTSYSIQKYYADECPGHSHPATMKMVERHLRDSRVWMTLGKAEILSRKNYPYAAHLKALRALGEAMGYDEYFMHEYANQKIARYECRFGQPPAPELSMAEIDAQLRKPEPPKRTPLTGLLAPYAKGGGE